MSKHTYLLFACNKDGKGRVMKIGEYNDLSDIEIVIGLFSNDTIITIEEHYEN